MQQLHPVTDTLLSHLSLSAPPQPAHSHIHMKDIGSLNHDCRSLGFVATHGVKRTLAPSGQGRFDSYRVLRMWSDTLDGIWLGGSHANLPPHHGHA